MPNDFVPIASFMFAPPALLLKSKLETEGIPSVVSDDNFVTLNPLMSNAVGGVKVKVYQGDVKKALSVLKSFKESDRDIQAQIDDQWAKGYTLADKYCPSCESAAVYRKKYPKHLFILGMILAPILGPLYIFLLLYKREFKCIDCGHTWKQRTY